MKRSVDDLAIFGGTPEYEKPLHIGQIYLPEWADFVNEFEAIFERSYFTNHGPLVAQLEQQLAQFLGVKHVICVTNGTISLMIAARALELSGEVIVPSFTFPATVQALSWCGLTPVFCDVDHDTHLLLPEKVEALINENTCAVLGVHLWGKACAPAALQMLCHKHGIRLMYDSAHALGCSVGGVYMGNYGDLESFSFHATKVLNGAEGGCITTNDDDVANRLRTIRNFHADHTHMNSKYRINGKMTEAQAAMALLGLRNLKKNIANNEELYSAYKRHSSTWDHVRMIDTENHDDENNFQYCVFEIDADASSITRDDLVTVLTAEGVLARRYFYPGVHRIEPYAKSCSPELPVTEKLCSTVFQLPIGASVRTDDVQRISDLVGFIMRHGDNISKKLSSSR